MRTAFGRISDITGQQRAASADAFCVAFRIVPAEPVAVLGSTYCFPDGVVGPQGYWASLVDGTKVGGFHSDVADFDADFLADADFSDSPLGATACREPNGKVA
jgi:hypothetical protein